MKNHYKKILFICLIVISCLFPVRNASSELVERIVAVVNHDVILLSEFKAAVRRAEENGKKADPVGIVNGIINERLLLKQAEKFNLARVSGEEGALEPDRIIENYINKRIRALIHISYREVEAYYYNNIRKYGGRAFDDVKSEIEEYLLGKMLETRLRQHIDELRENARIRIQLN